MTHTVATPVCKAIMALPTPIIVALLIIAIVRLALVMFISLQVLVVKTAQALAFILLQHTPPSQTLSGMAFLAAVVESNTLTVITDIVTTIIKGTAEAILAVIPMGIPTATII